MKRRTPRIALRAYRWATSPLRAYCAWNCARTTSFPVSVLFYHRVASVQDNPWTISFDGFEKQVNWLERNFELLSLAEVQDRVRQGRSGKPAVCITFDDGYAENLDQAIPLLLERGIPFTYFVSWSFIRDQRPFPHDNELGVPRPVNTIADIRSLAALGVDIGSHTMTHPDIGQVADPKRLHHEIVDSKTAIEDAIGRPVPYFAFPFGQRCNLTPAALDCGRRAGYHGMCSAFGAYNWPGVDPFHIRRFHADPEIEYVKKWLGLDPQRFFRRADAEALNLAPVAPPESPVRSMISTS